MKVELGCSFCNRQYEQLVKLVVSGDVGICIDCVNEILIVLQIETKPNQVTVQNKTLNSPFTGVIVYLVCVLALGFATGVFHF